MLQIGIWIKSTNIYLYFKHNYNYKIFDFGTKYKPPFKIIQISLKLGYLQYSQYLLYAVEFFILDSGIKKVLL